MLLKRQKHIGDSYTIVCNEILRNTRLSLKAKGLFVTVMGLPDTWDFSVVGITKIIKEGPAAIYAAMKELLEEGYVSRERIYDEGKITQWQYTFFDFQSTNSDGPSNENPTDLLRDNQEIENLDTENLEIENRGQLIKQEIKEPFNEINMEEDDSSSSEKTRLKAQIDVVWLHWKTVLNYPGAKLSPDRERKIAARLKDGYNVDQLKRAIDGCRASRFHMGDNDEKKKYDSVELIFRNAGNVDKFIGYNKPAAPAPQQKYHGNGFIH